MNASAVSTVLAEGLIIGTKIHTDNIWYTNIVFKCTGNLVYVSLLDNYLKNNLIRSTHFTIKYTNELFEYIFEGSVQAADINIPGYLIIEICKAEEKINMREYPRYDIYLQAELSSMWDDMSHISTVTNISLSGLAFTSEHRFYNGEECKVHIFIPDNNVVRLKGKIIRVTRKSDFINYGMSFTEIDDLNKSRLLHFIYSIEDKNTALKDLLLFFKENKYIL